jgi:hypothetical protein
MGLFDWRIIKRFSNFEDSIFTQLYIGPKRSRFGHSIWEQSEVLLGTYLGTHKELGKLIGHLKSTSWEP